MGADNLAQFHRWQGWCDIARLMPICVVDRPRATLKATASRAGQRLRTVRIPEYRASTVPSVPPPSLVFIHGRRSPLSSTLIRNSG
jgi:nicotinate-nucleotide adenylyltransferase